MKLRMSRVLAVTLIVAMFASLPTTTQGQDFGTTTTGPVEAPKPVKLPVMGKVDRYSVSIRALDTINSARLTVVFKGDDLRVLARVNDWYKIELPREFVMWVSKGFVKVGAAGAGVLTGDNVHARQGAGKEYRSVGMLDLGRRIEIVEEKNDWLKFRFVKGDTGYISARFVTLAGEDKPRVVEEDTSVKTDTSRTTVDPMPADKEETDKTVLDTFQKAEGVYAREVAREDILDWELDEAAALYSAVIEKTQSRKLANAARRRMNIIEMARRLQERTKPAAETLEKLAEAEKRIEEEFARKRRALEEVRKPVPVEYIQKGKIGKLAVATLQPCTHKLIQNGRLTHLLYSDTVDLDRYVGVEVGLQGEAEKSIKWPVPVIRVTGAVLSPDDIREILTEKPIPPSKPKETETDQPNVAPPAVEDEPK